MLGERSVPMTYVVEPFELKEAKAAHELFMVSLGALLLLGPMAIFLGVGRVAMLIPVSFSAAFTLYTYFRVSRSRSWFIEVHWRLALRNYRWLFIGYSITALLLLASWGVELSSSAGSPSQFLATALIRIGVMPTIVMVFACFVIENGALNQVLRHEVPERLLKKYPPPQDIKHSA
ncbi:MAG: hypothetical protein ABFS08_04190 [Pseudomonadota bacterium]